MFWCCYCKVGGEEGKQLAKHCRDKHFIQIHVANADIATIILDEDGSQYHAYHCFSCSTDFKDRRSFDSAHALINHFFVHGLHDIFVGKEAEEQKEKQKKAAVFGGGRGGEG